ncbi:hypothetical protein S40288_03393 [Stachybotrys chartarum IBT 40288]|nr:hypothetical protein S40288_03393 [Stachybotrys chartarum IBT 40288]
MLQSSSESGGAAFELEETAKATQLPFDFLDDAHRKILERAITRVLSTEIAEATYAQIVDGLPLSTVASESSHGVPYHGHPIWRAHQELCPGVLEKTREFGRGFRPETALTFDATNDGIVDWAPPVLDEFYWARHPDGALPTLFHHPWYVNHDQYPHGVADMVGYWAEGRIFGGVVLFDRRASESEDVYWHPDRQNVTYRIFKLLPEQKQALLHFLISENPPAPAPFPILGDKNNRIRVDPEESLATTGIYRDIWERKDRAPGAPDARLRDVYIEHGLDYVSYADFMASSNRVMERMDKDLYGEDWESDGSWSST